MDIIKDKKLELKDKQIQIEKLSQMHDIMMCEI